MGEIRSESLCERIEIRIIYGASPLVAEIPPPRAYAAHLTATDDRLRNTDQLRYAFWQTKSNSARCFGDCVSGKLRETSPQDQSEFGNPLAIFIRDPDRHVRESRKSTRRFDELP